jgi:hypothetical protein
VSAPANRSPLGTAHRIRIINFIEAHLNDPRAKYNVTPCEYRRAELRRPRVLRVLPE